MQIDKLKSENVLKILSNVRMEQYKKIDTKQRKYCSKRNNKSDKIKKNNGCNHIGNIFIFALSFFFVYNRIGC